MLHCLLNVLFLAVLQVAIRNTQQGVFYFNDQIPLTALMQEDNKIEPQAFVQSWKSLPEANESQKELPISITSLDVVKSKIQAANIFLMAHKQVCTQMIAARIVCLGHVGLNAMHAWLHVIDTKQTELGSLSLIEASHFAVQTKTCWHTFLLGFEEEAL